MSANSYTAKDAETLRAAAKIARESYPKESDYDPRFKIAAHSIAGTLERMADSLDATPRPVAEHKE